MTSSSHAGGGPSHRSTYCLCACVCVCMGGGQRTNDQIRIQHGWLCVRTHTHTHTRILQLWWQQDLGVFLTEADLPLVLQHLHSERL